MLHGMGKVNKRHSGDTNGDTGESSRLVGTRKSNWGYLNWELKAECIFAKWTRQRLDFIFNMKKTFLIINALQERLKHLR